MQYFIRIVICLGLAGVLAACSTTEVKPLTAGDVQVGSDADEVRLFNESARARKELQRRGLLLDNPELTRYLNQVLRRLTPPGLSGDLAISVSVVRDPVVNAYAFPDGSIYINLGLLERLDNEAQLAHVLAHELTHVVQRHGLSAYKDRKAKIIAAHITDLMLMGTSIAYIPYIASISSYSRAHEKEADEMALRLMSTAGYPLSGATDLFSVINDVKVQESVSQSIYSSHPDNHYRAQYTRDLIRDEHLDTHADASSNAVQYQAETRSLHVGNIAQRLLIKHYELALDSARRAQQRDPGNPWYAYYQGESLRLAAEDASGAAREHARLYDQSFNDELVAEFTGRRSEYLQQADDAYRSALALDPQFVQAYRGLGLVARDQGDAAASRKALEFYLANADSVSDRRYLENILHNLESTQ